MIRIVCLECDAGMAGNVGGRVAERAKTFDVEAPELEAWLTKNGPAMTHIQRHVTGVEVLTEVAR